MAGVASRRKAEELVFGGTVSVNGRIVTKPQTLVTLGRDRIAVDGREVGQVAQKKYAGKGRRGRRGALTRHLHQVLLHSQ